MKSAVFAGFALAGTCLCGVSGTSLAAESPLGVSPDTLAPIVADSDAAAQLGKAPRAKPNYGGRMKNMRMRGGRNGHRMRGGMQGWSGQHRWGNRINGKWHGGVRAPGGYRAYRRPFRGYTLPSYWINPGFYLQNYSLYGLSSPASGYGWSRYYDDAVLTDTHGRVYDHRSDIDWSQYEGGYADGYDDGYRVGYDDGVLTGGDRVSTGYIPAADPGAPVYTQGGEYEGAWSGNYVDDTGAVYQGSWSGSYEDEYGREYDADYSGTFIGGGRFVDEQGEVTYLGGEPHWVSGPPHEEVRREYRFEDGHDGYRGDYGVDDDHGRDYEYEYEYDDHRDRAALIERCRRDNGLGGAAIGGVLGGIAGNRIAGRGNRTEGTLIGAGVGAIAGAVVDVAEDDCREFRRPARPEQPRYRGGHARQGYYGYPGGYPYYYAPQQTVTTVTVQPSVATTTTTTTVVEEEYVTLSGHSASKKVWREPSKTKRLRR